MLVSQEKYKKTDFYLFPPLLCKEKKKEDFEKEDLYNPVRLPSGITHHYLHNTFTAAVYAFAATPLPATKRHAAIRCMRTQLQEDTVCGACHTKCSARPPVATLGHVHVHARWS